jgi:2-polyprenyl-6-methoxyphenol hydroxylase-like FAD-dependent oxidoreductase
VDRYVTIARSDLAAAIYEAVDGRVETVFGDTVEAIDDDGSQVSVTFRSGIQRRFDLVVGADGLHSRVRLLTFSRRSGSRTTSASLSPHSTSPATSRATSSSP